MHRQRDDVRRGRPVLAVNLAALGVVDPAILTPDQRVAVFMLMLLDREIAHLREAIAKLEPLLDELVVPAIPPVQ